MTGSEVPEPPEDAVAWVQEVLDTGTKGTIAPESEWQWTGCFACHWELDARAGGPATRTQWGDGPVQVSLTEALQWAAQMADRAVPTIGGQHHAPTAVPIAELVAVYKTELPAPRPFEPQ